MIRIAITQAAFDAIARTLPFGVAVDCLHHLIFVEPPKVVAQRTTKGFDPQCLF
jgi:hypothetical protein